MFTTTCEIRSIGIPRALQYYRYGELWTDFFSRLGFDVIISEETNRQIVETGSSLSIDESCYSAKVYLGHVQSLIGKCDAIFVPRIAGTEQRQKYCTRFESLYDLVTNTFWEERPQLLTLSSDWSEIGRAHV